MNSKFSNRNIRGCACSHLYTLSREVLPEYTRQFCKWNAMKIDFTLQSMGMRIHLIHFRRFKCFCLWHNVWLETEIFSLLEVRDTWHGYWTKCKYNYWNQILYISRTGCCNTTWTWKLVQSITINRFEKFAKFYFQFR